MIHCLKRVLLKNNISCRILLEGDPVNGQKPFPLLFLAGNAFSNENILQKIQTCSAGSNSMVLSLELPGINPTPAPVGELSALLDQVLQCYRIDFERIYLAGDSTSEGISGELMRRKNGLFAAVLLQKDPTGKTPSLPQQPSAQIHYCTQDELVSAVQWLYSIRQRFCTSVPLPEKYGSIMLENDSFTCRILPEGGGNIYSLRHKKSQTLLLREPHREEELFHAPERFGIPVLFPPNRIRDGRFLFEGKSYSLPANQQPQNVHIHGVAVNRKWNLLRKTENTAELLFIFDDNAPEYKSFPFDCRIRRCCELKEYGLCDTVSILNTGNKNMPLGLGFHTAFPAENATAQLGCAEKEIEIEKQRFLPTGKLLPWGNIDPGKVFVPDEYALSFHTEAGFIRDDSAGCFHGAKLQYASGTLRYITDEKFKFWYVWNGGGSNRFLCLEPVSWMADALNMKLPPEETGVRVLAPGKELCFVNRIEFTPSATAGTGQTLQ